MRISDTFDWFTQNGSEPKKYVAVGQKYQSPPPNSRISQHPVQNITTRPNRAKNWCCFFGIVDLLCWWENNNDICIYFCTSLYDCNMFFIPRITHPTQYIIQKSKVRLHFCHKSENSSKLYNQSFLNESQFSMDINFPYL